MAKQKKDKDAQQQKKPDRDGQKMPADRTPDAGPSTPGKEGSKFQPSAQP